jgi:DNA-binding response OmpR family regulator
VSVIRSAELYSPIGDRSSRYRGKLTSSILACKQSRKACPRNRTGQRCSIFFEDYALDTDRRELVKADRPIAVQPRVFDVLAFLIANPIGS